MQNDVLYCAFLSCGCIGSWMMSLWRRTTVMYRCLLARCYEWYGILLEVISAAIKSCTEPFIPAECNLHLQIILRKDVEFSFTVRRVLTSRWDL